VRQYDDGLVSLSGGLLGDFERTDLYLFCLSQSPDPDLIKDPEYDATYKIPSGNIEKFYTLLGEHIWHSLQDDHSLVDNGITGPFASEFDETPEEFRRSSMRIRCGVFGVSYSEKILKLSESSFEDTTILAAELIRNSHLIKPPEYRGEKEFRFIFEPRRFNENRYYPFVRRFREIFVSADPFLELIEVVRAPQ